MSNYLVKVRSSQDKLECQVQVFNGNKLVFERRFGALSSQYKLSPSGKYFVISLAFSNHEDSGKIFIFDVEERQLLFSGDFGIGHIYEFFYLNDTEDLYAKNHFGSYEIDKNGEVVDLEKVHSDAVLAADVYSIEYMERYLNDNKHSEKALRQVVHSLDRIIDSQFNEFHGMSWAALALRRRGEYLEMLDENQEAFLNYIDAIYLDAKIGVKRKLTRLSKILNLNWQDFTASDRALRIEQSCKLNREISIAKSAKDWEAIYDKNGKIVGVREIELQIKLEDEPQSIDLIDESKKVKEKRSYISVFINIMLSFLHLISYLIKPFLYLGHFFKTIIVKLFTLSLKFIYLVTVIIIGVIIFIVVLKFLLSV